MRAMRCLLFAFGAVCWVACGAPTSPAPETKTAPEPAEAAPDKEPAADPPPPPPAPEGAQLIGKIYVQNCAEPACPKLLQPAGQAHCKSLKQGDTQTWRLPTLEEAKGFTGVDGLQVLEGFHWTSSPYTDDDKQAWIMDPMGGQSTTIPRDRKPFTIRCVADIP